MASARCEAHSALQNYLQRPPILIRHVLERRALRLSHYCLRMHKHIYLYIFTAIVKSRARRVLKCLCCELLCSQMNRNKSTEFHAYICVFVYMFFSASSEAGLLSASLSSRKKRVSLFICIEPLHASLASIHESKSLKRKQTATIVSHCASDGADLRRYTKSSAPFALRRRVNWQ